MKSRILFLFLITTLTLFVAFPSVSFAENKTVFLTTGEWSPYTSKELNNYGITSQLVTEAFAASGFQVKFSFYPWKRSLELARTGAYQGTFPWQQNNERSKSFIFSDPIDTTHNYFFYKKGFNFKYDGLEDLVDLKVGTTFEYSYAPNFRKDAKRIGINLIDSDSDLTNITLLSRGRVDVAPMELHVANRLINEHFPNSRDQFRYHPKGLPKAQLSVLFNKSAKGSKHNNSFNKGLNILKKNGRYQEITGNSEHKQSLKVAITHRPPWSIVKDESFTGIDVDIIQEASKQIGLDVEFFSCPWIRCVEMVRSGQIDVLPNFSKTKSRLADFLYLGDPYFEERIVLYKKVNSPIAVKTYEDLRNYKIATTKGAMYFDKFDQDDSLNKIDTPYMDQQLKMLLFDRVDMVIGYEMNQILAIQQNGMSGEFETVDFTVPGGAAYMAISKNSSNVFFAKALQHALNSMITNQKIDEIIKRYVKE